MSQIGFAAGFAQMTTFGPGNVEIIVPWPGGGFAQYWYDRQAHTWNGPVQCVPESSGLVSSTSWHEGDYQSHDADHNNFELIAVESGRTTYWSRDNAPPYGWTRGGESLGGDLTDARCAALGRTHWDPDADHISTPFHQALRVFSVRSGGGLYQQHQNIVSRTVSGWDGAPFEQIVHRGAVSTDTEPVVGLFEGVAWALGTVGKPDTDFADTFGGDSIVVAVRADGVLIAYADQRLPEEVGRGVRGGPAIIQSDRGWSDPILGWGDHGHYEVFAPSRTGGIRQFWRPNPGGYGSDPASWVDAGTVGTGFYDEVSVVQLRDEDRPVDVTHAPPIFDSTPPLWLFARCQGQSWVDVFQQRHVGDTFVWEQLPTLGDPARPDVEIAVDEDFFVVSPLKSGEVRRIRYRCFAGSPNVWLRQTPGPDGWVRYAGDALRAKMRESTIRTDGPAAAEQGLDTFERIGYLDTPSMAAGTVVRAWGTVDPSADPNVTPPPRDDVRCVIATGRPGNLVEEGSVAAYPRADRLLLEITNSVRPVCLVAEIGEGAPAEHRPYGHVFHAFDRPLGRFVRGELLQQWQEELVRLPGRDLRPGGTYTVVVRIMDTRGYWSEIVAPVTLWQRQVDVTVDLVEIVASGDSGSADGWFSIEVYTGLARQGVTERVKRWQFGDEDNWAELDSGDVFGTGGSLHAVGPPWSTSIGPAPTAVRPFGVRVEIFDEDGLFEPDEHASGAWETENDQPVVDAPFTVRTDRDPPYATAQARGRYSITAVSPSGQPDQLDWRALAVDTSADVPVNRDYNGDGVPDNAVWRPGPGTWVIESSAGGLELRDLGGPGDVPAPGDYTGAGRAEPAVWRPDDGTLRTLSLPAATPLGQLPAPRLAVLQTSLAGLANDLWATGRRTEGFAARVQRVRVFEQLAILDPPAYQPGLVSALIDVCAWREADVDAALAAGRSAVSVAEQLAGLTAPVDYQQLGDKPTNVYWGGGYLAGAIYYLAHATFLKGDQAAAMVLMRSRVAVYERLSAVDPDANQPGLVSALIDVCAWRAVDLDAALAAGQSAVSVAEQLAGLTAPVDYRRLGDKPTNVYWGGGYLAGAIYYLAHVTFLKGDQAAAMALMRSRVAVYERLSAVDPDTNQPGLVSALIDVCAWREADVEAALAAGRSAVSVAERLAGLVAPVDYQKLGDKPTNVYWGGGYLAGAIYYLAHATFLKGDQAAAMVLMRSRVAVYERLSAVDPDANQPGLVSALIDVCAWRAVDVDAALVAGRSAVSVAEQLGGLVAPVDYQQLGDKPTNAYWGGGYLAGAIYYLAHATFLKGDQVAAMALMRSRVAVYERLSAVDPDGNRPGLVSALIDVCAWRAVDVDAALAAGRCAVSVAEQLAGLTAPVDYRQLGDQATNPYWGGGYLAGALYILAYALSDAGDRPAATASMQNRVYVYERLVAVDPGTYAAELASARADLAAFS